jgi:hypothetical protein
MQARTIHQSGACAYAVLENHPVQSTGQLIPGETTLMIISPELLELKQYVFPEYNKA